MHSKNDYLGEKSMEEGQRAAGTGSSRLTRASYYIFRDFAICLLNMVIIKIKLYELIIK